MQSPTAMQTWHTKTKEEGCLCRRKGSDDQEHQKRRSSVFVKKSCKAQGNRYGEQVRKESVEEFKQRTTTALHTVTQDTLRRVWEELEYRIDVCSVSGRSHIEHV